LCTQWEICEHGSLHTQKGSVREFIFSRRYRDGRSSVIVILSALCTSTTIRMPNPTPMPRSTSTRISRPCTRCVVCRRRRLCFSSPIRRYGGSVLTYLPTHSLTHTCGVLLCSWLPTRLHTRLLTPAGDGRVVLGRPQQHPDIRGDPEPVCARRASDHS
jgi:hypothetical protein